MKRTKNTATLIIAIVCAFFASMTASAKTSKSPKLSKNKATIETGKSLKLSVKNTGKNSVKWSSSNKKVATVSKNGKITAKKAGSAKITAKVGKKKLSCKVTVKPMTANYKKCVRTSSTVQPAANDALQETISTTAAASDAENNEVPEIYIYDENGERVVGNYYVSKEKEENVPWCNCAACTAHHVDGHKMNLQVPQCDCRDITDRTGTPYIVKVCVLCGAIFHDDTEPCVINAHVQLHLDDGMRTKWSLQAF